MDLGVASKAFDIRDASDRSFLPYSLSGHSFLVPYLLHGAIFLAIDHEVVFDRLGRLLGNISTNVVGVIGRLQSIGNCRGTHHCRFGNASLYQLTHTSLSSTNSHPLANLL